MSVMVATGWIFLGLGMLFSLVGIVGVFRFPDVYTRLHASSICATSATLSVLLGSLFFMGWGPMMGKTLVLLLFFLLSSPVTSHIIARYAWEKGITPWRKPRTTVEEEG